MTPHARQKLKRRYRITMEEYQELLEKQGGACGLCSNVRDERTQKQRLLVVDHCHVTGDVRGLLCISCNTRLGGLEDQPWFERAQSYLRRRPS